MTSLTCFLSNNSQPAFDYPSEKAKLIFLERKIRPVLPNHPLFNSDIYLCYKKWIENNTCPPLQLLALKKIAQNHQIYQMDDDKYQSLTDFAIFILNASLLEKPLAPKFNSAQQTFIGLFPYNPPLKGENLHLGILKTHPFKNNPEKTEVGFCIGLNNENPCMIGLAIEEILSEDNIIRTTGNKVLVPDFGSLFQGKVTKEIFDKNRVLLFRLTGIWRYIGNEQYGLTGNGSITTFACNGTKTNHLTGKWKNVNGQWRLTGHGSKTIYYPNGNTKKTYTGTWEHTEAEQYRLSAEGSETIYNPDGTIKKRYTGTWERSENGKIKLTGEGSEITYNSDGTIQKCYTGTWKYITEEKRVFIGSGSISFFDQNKKIQIRIIGTWEDTENRNRNFVGNGSISFFNQNKKIQEHLTGTWSNENGKNKLTGKATITTYNSNNMMQEHLTGIWKHTKEISYRLSGKGSRTTYNSNGTIEAYYTGTWEFPKKRLAGKGSISFFTSNGTLEECYVGTWSPNDEGKNTLIGHGSITIINEDKTSQKYTGTWSIDNTEEYRDSIEYLNYKLKNLKNDNLVLTGDGTATFYDSNKKKRLTLTGMWKHLGKGKFDLTGEGSETIYNPDGTIKRYSTGIWENTEDGKGKSLINNEKSLSSKKRKRTEISENSFSS